MTTQSTHNHGITFVILLLLGALIASIMYIVHLHRQQASTEDKLVLLQWEVSKLEETIEPLQQRIEALEKTSLPALANDANDVLQSGWNTLLGAVSKELQQAKKQWGEVWKELEQLELPEAEAHTDDQPQHPSDPSTQPPKPYSPDSAAVK